MLKFKIMEHESMLCHGRRVNNFRIEITDRDVKNAWWQQSAHESPNKDKRNRTKNATWKTNEGNLVVIEKNPRGICSQVAAEQTTTASPIHTQATEMRILAALYLVANKWQILCVSCGIVVNVNYLVCIILFHLQASHSNKYHFQGKTANLVFFASGVASFCGCSLTKPRAPNWKWCVVSAEHSHQFPTIFHKISS